MDDMFGTRIPTLDTQTIITTNTTNDEGLFAFAVSVWGSRVELLVWIIP